MIFTIFDTLFPIFGIIILGFFISRKGILSPQVASGVNQFVYWVGLPAIMFTLLAELDKGVLTGRFFLGLIILMISSHLLAYLLFTSGFRKRSPEADILTCMACFPNVVYMSLAMIKFLLPNTPEALSIAGIAAITFTLPMMYADAKISMLTHKDEKLFQALRSLLISILKNPMIMAAFIGLILGLLFKAVGHEVPRSILSMTHMLGNTAAPCALFCMGMVLNVQLGTSGSIKKGWFKRQISLHIFKLILLPVLTFAILTFVGTPKIVVIVMSFCSAMPSGVSAYVIAERYKVAPEDTVLGITMNTIFSILTISILLVVFIKLGYF